MIITIGEFLNRTKLDQQTLEIWIEEEWLIPETVEADYVFSDADIARAQLISDLIDDLGVNNQGVGVILHLLDQMHGLRFALASVVKSTRGRENSNV